MSRTRNPEAKGPDWPPDKTFHHLKQQLDDLQRFRARSWHDVRHDEEAWQQFTASVIAHGFGEPSQNLSSFNMARRAGEHYAGMSDHQRQANFELRIEKFQAALTSSIKELEATAPEARVPRPQAVQPQEAAVRPAESGVLILISHSGKDVSLASELTEFLRAGLALRADQIRCSSVDGYRLPAGADTDDRLREEVHVAKVLIGLITPNSLTSPYVLFELGARWGAELPMIPLLAAVEPGEIRGPLSGVNALSCTSEEQLHQLLRDVARPFGVAVQAPDSYLRYLRAVKQAAEDVSPPSVAPPAQPPRMVFEESVYWRPGNAGREGPYCPVCYDDKGKAVHLNAGATKGTFACGVCGNGFTTSEYDPSPARVKPFRA